MQTSMEVVPIIGCIRGNIWITVPHHVKAATNAKDLILEKIHVTDEGLLNKRWWLATDMDIAMTRLHGATIVLVRGTTCPARRTMVRRVAPNGGRPHKRNYQQCKPQKTRSILPLIDQESEPRLESKNQGHTKGGKSLDNGLQIEHNEHGEKHAKEHG